MKPNEFFQREILDDIFAMTVMTTNVLGFKRGDILTCRKTSKPIPGKIAILERDDCGRWPMLYDEAGPEIKAGARLIGQALCLSRDLDREA